MFQDEIHEQNMHFLAVYFEMRNSSLMILSENEDQLGTLAVAIPPTTGLMGGTEPISSILLGDRNFLIARIIAEHLSKKTQKIALVSIALRTVNEADAGPILLRLAEKIMKTSQETTQTAEKTSETREKAGTTS
jgi:hypothetical protein